MWVAHSCVIERGNAERDLWITFIFVALFVLSLLEPYQQRKADVFVDSRGFQLHSFLIVMRHLKRCQHFLEQFVSMLKHRLFIKHSTRFNLLLRANCVMQLFTLIHKQRLPALLLFALKEVLLRYFLVWRSGKLSIKHTQKLRSVSVWW